MCWDRIKNLFKREWQPPYPQEPYDPNQVLTNTLTYDVMAEFLAEREVPREYWNFWLDHVEFKIYESWPDYEPFNWWKYSGYISESTPGIAWEDNGIRHVAALLGYALPGMIAHECAHLSYGLLSEDEKIEYSNQYQMIKDNDQRIIELFKYNSYGLKNDIEAHAEIYRYLGEEMPDILKQFYPKLF
jgi:hypothetical protein